MSNILLNDLAMESFVDIRNDQPVRDRLHYFDVVLESTDSNKGTLIQKLYVDIISKSNIDFGKIPDSRGDLTKYEFYKEITSSIDALNQLTDSAKSDDLTMLNKLYDMIITLRSDYEFGYKFDIEFIKLTYNIAVMSLFEMVNVCIMEYANYLRDVKGIQFDFKKMRKKDIIIVRGVKSILKSYENGEWAKLMSQFKKDPKNAFGLTDILAIANKIPGMDLQRDASGAISGSLGTGMTVGLAIAGVIAVLLALRLLIYFFYSSAAKIDNYVSVQREFLVIALAKDTSGDAKSIKKQENMLHKLEGISNFIQNKIFKSDNDTAKALSDSNKDNFSKSDFASVSGNSNIELY
jgi:hypothetical protein